MVNEITVPKDGELQSINIKNWVTKSNDLIESTYKLSLQEQRILLIMASKVQPHDETLKTYRFRAKDFIEIIGNKKGTGFYSYLKEIVNGLQTKVLTIKKDGKQRNYNWVITSIYEDNEGYITLQFHPNLKDFFLELKEKFTTYQLENVVRLNSVYSIRVYELLKQYERLKKRELTIQNLRDLLGIEKDKYKQYGHFKNKVLLVAQNEINKKTDIRFEFNEIKTSRKVTSIEFVISSNNKKIKSIGKEHKIDNSSLDNNDDVLEIQEKGLTFGVNLSNKIVLEWLKYGKENIIKLMDEIKYKDNINNPIGFISSVLPTTVGKDIEQSADLKHSVIRKFIIKYKKNSGPLPIWLLQEEAIKEFKKTMSETAAVNLWIENKDEIVKELNSSKEKVFV